jgi:DNA-binding NarL/FixJ family response regulator
MLVDDQVLLREGLKTIVNIQEDMEVAAEAENGERALACMEKIAAVDVVLMDIQMPVMGGVEATAAIKKNYPGTAIVILTTFDDDDFIIDALTNGAAGYLLKDIDGPRLIQAIRDAHEGQLMLPGRIAAKLAARISAQTAPVRPLKEEGLASLNEREQEIGALLAQGLSNKQIAKHLFLSEGTVKNYISEIYSKLGTSNRTQAGLLLQQLNKK